MTFETMEYDSPIGPLILVARAGVLHVLAFAERWAEHRDRLRRHFGGLKIEPVEALREITPALDAYFAGELGALELIAAEPCGTPFQRRVWDRLRAIQVSRTASYGELARAIGSPTASRAVGAANGANPISLVLPCHRVVGSNGELTGYGGGLERKRWLLAHERRFAAATGAPDLIPLQAAGCREFPRCAP